MPGHVPVLGSPALRDTVPRGTRPRNRRELILVAAADLFVKHGYAKVGMSDLADAVGIGPSALYRHFAGKQDVLATVLAGGLDAARALVGGLDPADRSAAAAVLAARALDQRHLGLMWQREARDLSPAAYQPLRDVTAGIGRTLAGYVQSVRPGTPDAAADLLAWALLAVLTSPSFHHLDLPRPAYQDLLADLVRTVLDTDLPVGLDTDLPVGLDTDRPAGLDTDRLAGLPVGAAPARPDPGARIPALVPASRREELLTQAVRMFAAHGYTQVSIEDIGNAVGISGPSVYNHWPNKLDLLVTTLRRGAAALAMDVSTVYRRAPDAAAALRMLIGFYVALSQTHHETIGLLITDIGHLPDGERREIRRAQRDFVSEWVHLLRLDQPQLDPVAARIRVHAALSVANDIARTPHLRRDPPVAAAVEIICTRLLGLPAADGYGPN
jgi:AcrR family transcriptional regulator